nr:dienelactone hydrolase family protein [Kitasatospora cheerisanensis]
MNSPQISSDWVRPEGEGPELFVAAPEGAAPRGTVVVGMELFGVTAWVRGVCERLAAAGYAAVAPDFFGRTSPRADLPYDAAGRDEGFRLLAGLTADQVAADTAVALAQGASLGAGPGRAFAGFSVGGHLAFVAGTRLPLDLIVACYPGWLLDADASPFTAAPEPPLSPPAPPPSPPKAPASSAWSAPRTTSSRPPTGPASTPASPTPAFPAHWSPTPPPRTASSAPTARPPTAPRSLQRLVPHPHRPEHAAVLTRRRAQHGILVRCTGSNRPGPRKRRRTGTRPSHS